MENLVGKIAFIEMADPKSSYYNGEYFIVEQTEGCLYGYNLGRNGLGVYGLHDRSVLPLVGMGAVRICKHYVPSDDTRKLLLTRIDEAMREIAAVRNGTATKNWIDSVYSAAGFHITRVRELLEKKQEAPAPSPRRRITRIPPPAYENRPTLSSDITRSACEAAANNLIDAFRWGRSAEGSAFWSAVHQRLLRLASGQEDLA